MFDEVGLWRHTSDDPCLHFPPKSYRVNSLPSSLIHRIYPRTYGGIRSWVQSDHQRDPRDFKSGLGESCIFHSSLARGYTGVGLAVKSPYMNTPHITAR